MQISQTFREDAEQGEKMVEQQMVYSLDLSQAILRVKVWVIAGLTLITLATGPTLFATVMRIKYGVVGRGRGSAWGRVSGRGESLGRVLCSED